MCNSAHSYLPGATGTSSAVVQCSAVHGTTLLQCGGQKRVYGDASLAAVLLMMPLFMQMILLPLLVAAATANAAGGAAAAAVAAI